MRTVSHVSSLFSVCRRVSCLSAEVSLRRNFHGGLMLFLYSDLVAITTNDRLFYV